MSNLSGMRNTITEHMHYHIKICQLPDLNV